MLWICMPQVAIDRRLIGILCHLSYWLQPLEVTPRRTHMCHWLKLPSSICHWDTSCHSLLQSVCVCVCVCVCGSRHLTLVVRQAGRQVGRALLFHFHLKKTHELSFWEADTTDIQDRFVSWHVRILANDSGHLWLCPFHFTNWCMILVFRL